MTICCEDAIVIVTIYQTVGPQTNMISINLTENIPCICGCVSRPYTTTTFQIYDLLLEYNLTKNVSITIVHNATVIVTIYQNVVSINLKKISKLSNILDTLYKDKRSQAKTASKTVLKKYPKILLFAYITIR